MWYCWIPVPSSIFLINLNSNPTWFKLKVCNFIHSNSAQYCWSIAFPDNFFSDLLFFPPPSLVAAGLMHTFNAHAATDITGFGILGHAQNLAKQQRNEVSFVIHNLPVLAKMAAVSKACGNMFGLMHGTCPETSGRWQLYHPLPSLHLHVRI